MTATSPGQGSSGFPRTLPLPGLVVPAVAVQQGKRTAAVGAHRFVPDGPYCERCQLPRRNGRHQ